MFKKRATFFLLIFSTLLFGQKKAISHNDYDLWKQVGEVVISNKGKLIVTEIETVTGRGDGSIEIFNTLKQKKTTINNGLNVKVTFDESYVVLKQKPDYILSRQERKQKIKKEDRSKETLLVFNTNAFKVVDSITNVKDFKLPKENSEWLIIEKFKDPKTKDSTKQPNI